MTAVDKLQEERVRRVVEPILSGESGPETIQKTISGTRIWNNYNQDLRYPINVRNNTQNSHVFNPATITKTCMVYHSEEVGDETSPQFRSFKSTVNLGLM